MDILNIQKIDIIEDIGTNYYLFSLLLLNDEDGYKLTKIMGDNKYAPNFEYKVKQVIIEEWSKGKGRRPVTWPTFIKVLKEMGLKKQVLCILSSLQGRPTIQGRSTLQHRLTLQDQPTLQGQPTLHDQLTLQDQPTLQGRQSLSC